MKRIQFARLEQTLHFFQKDEGVGRQAAMEATRDEVTHYKAQLDRSHTRYRVVSQQELDDGSIVLKVLKQYNGHECGEYLE
ncbi:MAG: hypothetical protein PHY12_02245 [Eubacteriales bacterium]|nr:hypothetical protein [Eubacteriales bacterium]